MGWWDSCVGEKGTVNDDEEVMHIWFLAIV